jgi:hypothetical protein
MAQDETLILSPKDPSLIFKLQDPTTIEQLLENPPAVLAELLAGWFAGGNGLLAAAGCRIAQAAFKGRVFEQFAREFNDLRRRGRIPDDFNEKKYGQKSWIELLTILDEEVPDEDRLEALKAMFYSVNKINASDGERILAYQLFSIAKELSSGQLLYLKASYAVFKDRDFNPSKTTDSYLWQARVGRKVGHQVLGLLDQNERALIEHGLLTPRVLEGSAIREADAHLTDLGIKFCENIETYHIDLSGPEQ